MFFFKTHVNSNVCILILTFLGVNLEDGLGFDGLHSVVDVRFEMFWPRTFDFEFWHELGVDFERFWILDESLCDLSGVVHSPTWNSFDLNKVFARNKVEAHNADLDLSFL